MKEILQILWEIRQLRKAFRLAQARRVLQAAKANEIVRNAAGYGWEIARGAPMIHQINTTPSNPFLNPNWREMIKEGVEE